MIPSEEQIARAWASALQGDKPKREKLPSVKILKEQLAYFMVKAQYEKCQELLGQLCQRMSTEEAMRVYNALHSRINPAWVYSNSTQKEYHPILEYLDERKRRSEERCHYKPTRVHHG